jgi:hypothetical protein
MIPAPAETAPPGPWCLPQQSPGVTNLQGQPSAGRWPYDGVTIQLGANPP